MNFSFKLLKFLNKRTILFTARYKRKVISMSSYHVSVIIPVHNADTWLDQCLESVLHQQFNGNIEVSIYNDASTDKSAEKLEYWKHKFLNSGIGFQLGIGDGSGPKGVGYAKNRAIEKSIGEYLCFLDADDVMHHSRIQKQFDACITMRNAIVGCKFHREPENSTPRYTSWANSLSESELYAQIYTAFGPTIVMPTWFCHRSVYETVGKFNEAGKGTPEDLLFFFAHLKHGGKLHRVDDDLLLYRYHPAAATFSVLEDTIWSVRLKELEQNILVNWSHFTIWNAGKQGRKLYKTLSAENQKKVEAFCDVDVKKIKQGVYIYEESKASKKPRIPIIPFTSGKPPFVLCVKLGMTNGQFENNLASLKLLEGIDYIHFS